MGPGIWGKNPACYCCGNLGAGAKVGCSIHFCLGEFRGGLSKEKVKFKLIRGRRRKKTARQKKETTVLLKSEEKARMLEASMHGRTWQGVSVGTEGGAVWRLSCARRKSLDHPQMRLPCSGRRSNQSILNEINPEHILEGLMLKLKLQYFGSLMGKDPDARKDGRQKEKGLAEDEMAGWHHQSNRHELGQT